MIVAIDIREWQPGSYTGIGRFLEEFLSASACAAPANRFVLIADRRSEVRVQPPNATLLRIPERSTLWWDQVILPRAAAQARADILYSPYIKIPLVSPVPAVSTVHDLTFIRRPAYRQQPSHLLLNPPFRIFCRLVVRRAAALVADSQATARDLTELLGADPGRVRVVPLATSPRFQPATNPAPDLAVLARYGLSSGYVLYVGGFAPHKNVPCLIRAHAGLPSDLRAIHPLVLVGAHLPPPIRGLVEQSRERGALRWIGPVADADLPSLYRRAAVFAFPSFYEGFGLPVLEAMACGTPTLCSTAPALRELADGIAVHADPENSQAWQTALFRLLTDDGLRTTMAARGVARAEAFSPARMAAGILRVLEEVAALAPHSGSVA